ncbi:unnamed protein product [Urochloa decumbens]|uniref:Uncharacterized protein n=1 Tax=Urochloa decumbens TaxID=240449 RepID=A0ABC9GFW2_9POAL
MVVVPAPGGAAGGGSDAGVVVSAAAAVSGSVGGAKRGGSRVKGSWTPEEDDLLRAAVARHGARNWSVISAEIPGRSGKSCRLRWCNQLSPGVERRPFTPEEDALIVAAHAQYGNKWATIARMLHGRTDNSVKNHWNSTLRRQRRAAAAAAANANGALAMRPLAVAAAGNPPPAVPLRHLLPDPESASLPPAMAPPCVVPFRPLDLKDDGGGEDEEDDEEEEEFEDEDGSSEDSVLMPPPKKRPCLGGVGAGHAHPSLLGAAAKKPEQHTAKPLEPPTPQAPAAEPLTSLTLSLPGAGGGGGAVPVTPEPQGAAAAVASVDGTARMRARLEQDCPWLLPVMRQMICEEVHRHLQGGNGNAPPAAAASGND